MTSIIQSVKLSRQKVAVGESIQVDVRTTDPSADVSVNNVAGAHHFLQFDTTGSHTIVITASAGKKLEQTSRRVKIQSLPAGVPAYPLICSAMDRYMPRTVNFSLTGYDRNVSSYGWDFGDGKSATSEGPSIAHDYTTALARDKLTTSFDVTVTAQYRDGSVAKATRTIAIFCLYAYNKIRHGVLTPRVDVLEPAAFQILGIFLLGFTIHNLEDEDLSLSEEKHEFLTTEPDTAPITKWHLVPGEVLAASASALEPAAKSSGKSSISFAGQMLQAPYLQAPLVVPGTGQDIRIPARSSLTVWRVFQDSDFKKPTFGVAIHLEGEGSCTHIPVVVSAYIEVRIPLEWGGAVINPRLIGSLARLSLLSNQPKAGITHALLGDLNLSSSTNPSPADIRARETPTLPQPPKENDQVARLSSPSAIGAVTQIVSTLHDLISPEYTPLDDPVITIGAECDPDNLPDTLPEGVVCQLTAETAWRFVPGRVLNAKKGDLVLSHDGHHLIGQMLQQLTPPQFYSHSGIMTKNHIELRHSTASEEWLLDHPDAGHGFDATALKYLWPGTITQSIDEAAYFQWLNSPDKRSYQIHGFNFDPDTGSATTIVNPLVVKPTPFAETATVRLTLHSIADAARDINGHYRFYCYTDPAIALDSAYVAGADAGWAEGTMPTVCSSFIWLSAQRAGVRLEGANAFTSVSDLEPTDVISGAAVETNTRDGLYLYSAGERQSAGRWLYQAVYDRVYSQAGWLGRLLTDAPDNYANQICNTFASDWDGDGSADSDQWRGTGSANAVSPDDTTFWDSPGPGNQNQFSSVYGHIEDLFYRPGSFQQVQIWRWKQVPTRGNLTGTVVANGNVTGANVSLQGSGKPDVVVGSDGRFEFDNVPATDYSVSAGLNIDNYWNSADVPVHITAGGTTDVTVTLQPPPEVNRWITVSVDMETDWSSAWAHSPHGWSETKSARVHPFHSHEHLEFGGGDTPRGEMIVDIDLNADLSVTISYALQEIDDEVEGVNTGGFSVAAGYWHSRSGISVSNGDPIDNDQTICNITVNNDQASA